MDQQRQLLKFPDAVERAFSFLLDAGFQVVATEPTLVVFKNIDLVAAVYHGRHSYEVGFEIGRGGERFSLGEIIRSEDPDAAASLRYPAATTRSTLVSAVQSVAKLVQRYGERVLGGDPSYFVELRRQRRLASKAYALNVLVSQTRPKADAAFREGRYQVAAELYDKMAARLTPAEQKKLVVARKKSRKR